MMHLLYSRFIHKILRNLGLVNSNEPFKRYLQATWDLNEVVAKKDEIVRDNLLVTKLAGPTKTA